MIIKKPNFWKNINFFSLILLPFSLITLCVNFLKSIFVKEKSFNIPIICVGNIFTGGTGKTPLSIYIYNFLKKNKLKPALIRKYYKSHIDEIDLTKSKVKSAYFEKNRVNSILNAEQNGNNVIIMDDGFQDRNIQKNLNIICFNSMELIGNGFLLPSGPLREPFKSIRKAQIIIINGKRNIAFEKKIKFQSKDIKLFYSKYKLKKINRFRNKKILAFAGIGNPESFFNLLKKSKINVKDQISFPDHYSYTKNDIKYLISESKKRNLKLLTTEKDNFRLKKLGFKNIDYITVDLEILKYKNFEREILKYL